MFEDDKVRGYLRNFGQSRLLSMIIGLLLTAACLTFVGYLVYLERDVMIMHLRQANGWQLLAVAACYIADLAIYIWGWATVMAGLDNHLNLGSHARIFCLANLTRRLPGTLWYLGGRAALYSHVGIPQRIIVAASAIELVLIEVSGLILSIPFLVVILSARRWVWLSIGGLLAGVLIPWVIRRLLNRILSSIGVPSPTLGRVYGWLAIYGGGWIVGGVFVFMILTIFQPLSINHLPSVIGDWILAGTFSMITFFLPSGFGVTEATLTALLYPVVPAGVAALTAISVRLIGTLMDVVFGGVAYFGGMVSKHK